MKERRKNQKRGLALSLVIALAVLTIPFYGVGTQAKPNKTGQQYARIQDMTFYHNKGSVNVKNWYKIDADAQSDISWYGLGSDTVWYGLGADTEWYGLASDTVWYGLGSDTNIKIDKPITVYGKVNLFLSDDYTLEANAGIIVPEGSTLNIYGGSLASSMKETGTLKATGKNGGAAIGGKIASTGGKIHVYGGNVYAKGSNGAMGIGAGKGAAKNGVLTVDDHLGIWGGEDESEAPYLRNGDGTDEGWRYAYMKLAPYTPEPGPEITTPPAIVPNYIVPGNTPTVKENDTPTPAKEETLVEKETPVEKEKTVEKGKLVITKVVQAKSKLRVSWNKLDGANYYELFVQYCGSKFPQAPIKVTKKRTSVVVEELNGEALKQDRSYKIYVVAYKVKGNKKRALDKTVIAHVAGKDLKGYSNPAKLIVEKTKVSIKSGKHFTLRPLVVLEDKNKKALPGKHVSTFRYASMNEKVATVDEKGKVTAIGAGKCSIYVYAQNGYAKKVTVIVK